MRRMTRRVACACIVRRNSRRTAGACSAICLLKLSFPRLHCSPWHKSGRRGYLRDRACLQVLRGWAERDVFWRGPCVDGESCCMGAASIETCHQCLARAILPSACITRELLTKISIVLKPSVVDCITTVPQTSDRHKGSESHHRCP